MKTWTAHILLTILLLLSVGLLPACHPPKTSNNASLLLLLQSQSASRPVTCGTSPTAGATALPLDGTPATGTLDATSTSVGRAVYSIQSTGTSPFLLSLYHLGSGINGKITLCDAQGTTLQSSDTYSDFSAEHIQFVSPTATTYYVEVVGFRRSSSGSGTSGYSLSAVTGAVSGGGSCTTFESGKASECRDYAADYLYANSHCTASAFGATYSAGACPTANRRGRCTANDANGSLTYVGYNGDFADTSSLSAYCNSTVFSLTTVLFQAN